MSTRRPAALTVYVFCPSLFAYFAKNRLQDDVKASPGPSSPHPAFDPALLRQELKAGRDFFCAGLEPGGLAARLMLAAAAGDAAALQNLLKNPGALPDFENAYGVTPLMAAVARGHAEATELLARHPLVNLGRADRDGWTALHFAQYAGEAETARLLRLHHAPPAEMAPAPAAPPEKDALADAFFRAVTVVGLEWQRNPALDTAAALRAKIAALPRREFAAAVAIIAEARPDFDWRPVFIAAAAVNNTEAMRFLHNSCCFDGKTLSRALAAALGAADNRDAAHHLVIWGADPNAAVTTRNGATTLAEAAFALGRTGALEEMMLWSNRIGKDQAARYGAGGATKVQAEALKTIAAIFDKKNAVRQSRPKTLRSAFHQAVGNGDLAGTMAAYAEGRRDRLLRGTVEFIRADGGGAIALALRRERYEFARLLISEGYALKDAPEVLREELRLLAPAKAKQFAEEHLAGRLEVEPVERRVKRSDLPPIYFGGMGHYGMF
jgi:ankyrin repeat protein